MINIKGISAIMTAARFDFQTRDGITNYSVEQNDSFIIKKIKESSVELEVCRELKLKEIDLIMAQVIFMVNIDCEDCETENSIEEEIRRGIPVLSNVFSRISLMISEATSNSQFGPIVTMPTYDNKKVSIKNENVKA